MPVPLEERRANLVAALAALQCRRDPSLPELDLVHEWLDNWSGVGLIVGGMQRQGYEVVFVGGRDGWSLSFFEDRPSGGPAAVSGNAHAATPWRAAQDAAWTTLQRADGHLSPPPPPLTPGLDDSFRATGASRPSAPRVKSAS